MRIKIKKLPIATILLAIIFAIGILLFVNAYSKKSAFSELGLWGSKTTVIESSAKDSDNDGLLDWQENLYKTDSLNPDTDGDGYLDGEEINSGHNPLVKGPNDKQIFYPLPIGDKYNVTNKVFTDFDAVIKSYLDQKNQYAQDHPEIKNPTQYLAEASQGAMDEMIKRAMLYNESDWAEKANAVLEQMPEVFNIEISDNDIKISGENNVEAIKKYFEMLSTYMQSENFLLQPQSLISLKDALSTGDFSQVESLILYNDDELTKLIDTLIPDSWKDIHKKALKLAITARNIFVSLRDFNSDPIKAIVGMNEIKNVQGLSDELNAEIKALNQSQKLNLEI